MLTTPTLRRRRTRRVVWYRVDLIERDMAMKGWIAADLAARAKVSHPTLSRFLAGQLQTPRTARKLAKALGQPLSRYLMEAA